MAIVENGKEITFEYTLTVDGEVMDSSKESEPLNYTHGDGKLIPGLTKRMEGMELGEEREIEVPSEEGYGPVKEQAFQEVLRTKLPENVKPEIGMVLQAQRPDGTAIPVKVSGIKDDSVIIDMNHPLAGKDLLFKIKVIEIA
jgi:FKBP-type peptidyl-prolyl cis-trans isomerase 2